MKLKTLFVFVLIVIFDSALAAGVEKEKVRRGKVLANGISIAYEAFGPPQGETILLIHGLGSQLTDWPIELMERLAAKGYQVIRYDHRDIGHSGKMDTLGRPDWGSIFPLIGSCGQARLPYTLNDMAADAVGLLDALEIGRAHLVGCSMGGAIAQLMAIHYPDRVLSLVSMMASSGNPARPQPDADVMKLFAEPFPDTTDPEQLAGAMMRISKALDSPAYPTDDVLLKKKMLEHVQRSWHPEGRERHAAAVLIGDNCDRREALSKLKVPVVVIHGTSDPLVKVESGREVAAAIPGSRLITLEGMGHHIPEQLIDEVVDAILMATKGS